MEFKLKNDIIMKERSFFIKDHEDDLQIHFDLLKKDTVEDQRLLDIEDWEYNTKEDFLKELREAYDSKLKEYRPVPFILYHFENPIGWLVFTPVSFINGTGTVGIAIEETFKGKGVGTEALSTLYKYLPSQFNWLHKLSSRVHGHNERSLKMHERIWNDNEFKSIFKVNKYIKIDEYKYNGNWYDFHFYEAIVKNNNELNNEK